MLRAGNPGITKINSKIVGQDNWQS